MKITDLLTHYAEQLRTEREHAMSEGLDAPIDMLEARHLRTVGGLHQYAVTLPADRPVLPDVPVTILPSSDHEPTEGTILDVQAEHTIVQTMDAFGAATHHGTLIPDTSGFLETAAGRLEEMASKPEAFTLGPAERLVAWVEPDPHASDTNAREQVSTSVLGTLWEPDTATRWPHVSRLLIEQAQANKRVLLISPTHRSLDELTGAMAKALRNAPLPYKSLLSRYEMSVSPTAADIDLLEIGFEAHMSQFYSKANSHKASLRKKYDRFRELTPILAYKRDKQKDLNEVKLLEWRLLNSLSEWQGKIKALDQTVADYEAIPLWKRLAMQTAGKNVETLRDYRVIYERNIDGLMREVEIAQHRIRELVPEATIPKDLRPEYDSLKEDITKLGGTRKIRDMLAAGEGTNRQAFLQNKRIVAATASRILTDPLFVRARFDLAIIDDAPHIPAPCLLAAAGIVRERIVLCGNPNDLLPWDTPAPTPAYGQWPQRVLR